MKTIITSLLLIFCLSVSAQDTTNKIRIILRTYSTMYVQANDIKDSIRNVLKKMEYEEFMSIPQSEINLGLHKFKKQHITGNHLIIAGIVSSLIGGLIMITSNKADNPTDTYTSGLVFTAIGGGLTTAGFIVNIDSFRHIK